MKSRLQKKLLKVRTLFDGLPNFSPRKIMHLYNFYVKFNKNFYRNIYKEIKQTKLKNKRYV